LGLPEPVFAFVALPGLIAVVFLKILVILGILALLTVAEPIVNLFRLADDLFSTFYSSLFIFSLFLISSLFSISDTVLRGIFLIKILVN